MWRVSENDFDVDYFVEKFQIQDRTAIFYQGEKRRRGKIRDKSGFNVSISENLSASVHVEEIKTFIASNGEALLYLMKKGIKSTFDIGCSVETELFTKSISIPPGLLLLLNQFCITLEFTAYPSTDE